jgi:hypothetical protein
VNSGIHWTSSAAIYRYAVSYVRLQPVDDGFSAERCSGDDITYGINKILTAHFIIF